MWLYAKLILLLLRKEPIQQHLKRDMAQFVCLKRSPSIER